MASTRAFIRFIPLLWLKPMTCPSSWRRIVSLLRVLKRSLSKDSYANLSMTMTPIRFLRPSKIEVKYVVAATASFDGNMLDSALSISATMRYSRSRYFGKKGVVGISAVYPWMVNWVPESPATSARAFERSLLKTGEWLWSLIKTGIVWHGRKIGLSDFSCSVGPLISSPSETMNKAPISLLIRVVALPLSMRLEKVHLDTRRALFQTDEYPEQRFDRRIAGRYPTGLVPHQEYQSDSELFLQSKSYDLRGH